MIRRPLFFNDTATTEIYTLSLHDALPIFGRCPDGLGRIVRQRSATCQSYRGITDLRWIRCRSAGRQPSAPEDRKSTRLNSSHANISYAVFCLKKKSRFLLEQIHRQSTDNQ